MQSMVISLETAIERRAHIQGEFEKQNINYTFFSALTPKLAQPLAEKMNLNIQSERLTSGELACFMSHVALWQKMVDENIPYMAIFEDDVFLGEDAAAILNSDEWIHSGWNIIKIEAFSPKVMMDSPIKIPNTIREVQLLKDKHLGTAGYILSLQGAQAYLDYIKRRPLIPLDELMFDVFVKERLLDIYQMSPGLCIQEMILYPEKASVLPSNLLLERKQRMKKFKKKGWEKVRVEIQRILTQIQYAFSSKEIKFK
ncbi:glycosyltransferase family 25 protein [Acinetobacter equi]|uniref:Glycosyl transferase n=1 Tax=Acinetobacter equi TaxID=1324350 RepID=A0A0N9W119_9GAMM|nr:glycosyltransferase family 25 protein [Acinetobacter equi]ALH95210.1 glycosyl transferase [Acinetobacter equi]